MRLPAVHSFLVLSPEECRRATRDVFEMKSLWVGRGSDPVHPYFYTLGAASYLDGLTPDLYSKKALEQNLQLEARFGWLYEKLLSALSAITDGELHRFDRRVAFPGFHIYPRNMPNGGRIHSDQQFRSVPWADAKSLDFDRVASVTLPIQVPSTGAGLRYWSPDLTTRSQGIDLNHLGPFCEETYQVGHAYYLSGQLIHQIAPNPEMIEGEARVTLQAHAIGHRDGYWVIYW